MDFPDLPNSSFSKRVTFDAIDVKLPSLDQDALEEWLAAVAQSHGSSIHSLSYVLCSDAYLHKMNLDRLDHDTLTDIITFDLRNSSQVAIEGECYISLERVKDNASTFGESPEVELLRVFVHGLLHLCGLGDKTSEESSSMRLAENEALQLIVD